jgi:hypothetical protein
VTKSAKNGSYAKTSRPSKKKLLRSKFFLCRMGNKNYRDGNPKNKIFNRINLNYQKFLHSASSNFSPQNEKSPFNYYYTCQVIFQAVKILSFEKERLITDFYRNAKSN